MHGVMEISVISYAHWQTRVKEHTQGSYADIITTLFMKTVQ